jgi:site-specific DNA-methyltransferase (adenine-specific)
MNNLIYGDCLEKMQDIDDKSIDLILCDLPYSITKCSWDILIPFDKLWEQYNRIIKDNGAITLTSSQPFTTHLISSNIKNFKYCWIWQKNCPSNIACGNYMPLRYTEDICVFYKNQPKYNKQMIERDESGKKLIKGYQDRGTTFKLSASEVSSETSTEVDPNHYSSELKNPSNLIYFGVDRGRKYKHPSKKPVALFEYLIKTYTNENDLVLDNCAGSFTTAIAADNLSRNWICIEKNLDYCKLGLKRINENREKLNLDKIEVDL